MVNWPENHHSGQNIDTSTPEGWLFFYMNAAFDQSQHKIIVENTQARLKSARKNGRIGSRPTLMTDKRIRVAQSMHKNPIGSFVPLWDLTQYLSVYINETGLRDDPKGFLFRTIGRGTGQLTSSALMQANAHAMIQKHIHKSGIDTKVGNHSFRATGITAYLKNGSTLEKAAIMANHSSTRTTQLYDRRRDEMTLDEVERIMI
ncbi:MAG TPA: tyrosine-type recombinase/integrase [Nitrosomonas sp.]|nr:tyrosine-type recombinase/integrase [Nitrosomonas sp.]HQX14755.1 tyrosine-type recombinase/integrase [Nitrosomonas sp.]